MNLGLRDRPIGEPSWITWQTVVGVLQSAAIKALSMGVNTLTWRRDGRRAEGPEERSPAVVPVPSGGDPRWRRLTLVRLRAGMIGRKGMAGSGADD